MSVPLSVFPDQPGEPARPQRILPAVVQGAAFGQAMAKQAAQGIMAERFLKAGGGSAGRGGSLQRALSDAAQGIVLPDFGFKGMFNARQPMAMPGQAGRLRLRRASGEV